MDLACWAISKWQLLCCWLVGGEGIQDPVLVAGCTGRNPRNREVDEKNTREMSCPV